MIDKPVDRVIWAIRLPSAFYRFWWRYRPRWNADIHVMKRIVKAFGVPRPGTHLPEEELLALCRRRLEEYAVPWEIEFREELPKSFVGKVLRRMLVEE